MAEDRLKQVFARKDKKVLNIYCTAGYPELDSTLPVMQALQKNGADIIELGVPYSDPLADGPVIQQSGGVALENGMSIKVLFKQLKTMRNDAGITVPVILMGYFNPVLQYGFEEFCADASALGIDGLILPDIPIREYELIYGPIMKKYKLHFVFLITPETSVERIRKIDALSTGFIYAVSSSSTTGNNKNFDEVEQYLYKIKQLQLKSPVLVGFGVKDKYSFAKASEHTQGAIIGSAYIKALQQGKTINDATKQFLDDILL